MQSDLHKELLNVENQFWQCMKDKNIAKALEMTKTHASLPGHRAWRRSTRKLSRA